MKSIGVRELKEHLSEILRQVQEEKEIVEVTNRGTAIARLIPIQQPQPTPANDGAVWISLEQLAEEISARWPRGVSAVDAVNDVRGDF